MALEWIHIALLASISICGWVFLTAASSASPMRRGLPMMLPALAAAVWSAGELGVQRALVPGEVTIARRLLYLGAFGLPIAWLWAGVTVMGPSRGWPRGRAFPLLGVPLLFVYSSLYWDDAARLVSLTGRPPLFGPWFWPTLFYAWALTAAGTFAFVRATQRLGQGRLERSVAVALGALFPFCGHVVSMRFELAAQDPTPAFVGFGLGLIQLAIFDAGVNGFLPVARRDVVQNLKSAVLVADLRGIVVDANPAALALLGADGVLGRPLATLLDGVRADASRVFEIEVAPVRGSIGPAGHYAVLSDRTDARRDELQVLQTHKLQALGVLTAGIAHEVNNPLAFVQANLSALQELAEALRDPAVRAALPEKLEELALDAPDLVSESLEGVARIGRLVRQLRSFARGEGVVTERGPVDLAEVTRKACTLAGVGLSPGALRTSIAASPPVLANEDELVQIAVNLIVNAVQASERGGVDIEVTVGPARDGVALTVRDRGPGISEDVLPRIFDPFFTTKPPGQGVGLGLSLSFDLARRSGGTLEARNRPGGGAELELWLPVTSPEPSQAELHPG